MLKVNGSNVEQTPNEPHVMAKFDEMLEAMTATELEVWATLMGGYMMYDAPEGMDVNAIHDLREDHAEVMRNIYVDLLSLQKACKPAAREHEGDEKRRERAELLLQILDVYETADCAKNDLSMALEATDSVLFDLEAVNADEARRQHALSVMSGVYSTVARTRDTLQEAYDSMAAYMKPADGTEA